MNYFLDNINGMTLLFFSLLCFSFGLVCLTRKKLMYSNIVPQIFITPMILILPIRDIARGQIGLSEIAIYTVLLLSIFYIYKTFVWGKYTILNMNYDIFSKEFLKLFSSNTLCDDNICIATDDLNKIMKKVSINAIGIDLRAYSKSSSEHNKLVHLAREIIKNNNNTRYLSYDSIIIVLIGVYTLIYALSMLEIV